MEASVGLLLFSHHCSLGLGEPGQSRRVGRVVGTWLCAQALSCRKLALLHSRGPHPGSRDSRPWRPRSGSPLMDCVEGRGCDPGQQGKSCLLGLGSWQGLSASDSPVTLKPVYPWLSNSGSLGMECRERLERGYGQTWGH